MIFTLLIIGIVAGRVSYKGDTLNYLWKEKIILLTGNAEVKTPEVTAKADTIKYDANKGIVTASGKPILWVGGQKIDGKCMVYDLESGEGIVYNGRTQIQKGWFDGKIIRRVEPDVLNIDYGKFTTCEYSGQGKPPHYYFWGRELKVYINNMVFTRPLILFVHDIPLFYAPFWWFPIKKGRQSGLLHPKIGRSAGWGRYVENLAYYWVINGWSDATFTLDYFELLGPRASVEGRWLISRTGSGNFNSSYIVEKGEDKRWAIDCSHSQNFENRLSLRADGHFVSDAQYKVDYEEERLVQLDKIMDSYLSLSKSWDIGTTSFMLQEWRNLATDSVSRKLPSISYSLTQMRILGVNFRYEGSFTNSSMSEEYKQLSQNTASFSLPFRLFKYLSVSPATSHTYTWQQPDNLPKPYRSTHSVSLSTNIYGKSIFKPELRHIMGPSLTYSVEDTTHRCTFGVSNNFQLIMAEKEVSLARLDLGSSWNFQQNRLNPVSISVYSTPLPLLNLQSFATYKPEADIIEITRIVVSSRYSIKDFSVSVSYNCVPLATWSDKSLQIELNTKLTKNWRLSGSRRYDLIAQEVISERFSIYRDLHCWEMVFNFDSYGEEWRYDFQLKLKAIPEIKVGKSLFGIFL